MRTVESWKSKTFFAVLIVITFVINFTINPPTPPASVAPSISAPASSSTTASPSAPATGSQDSARNEPTDKSPPPIAPLKIWPSDFEPTRTIRIPDPNHPSTGIMDLSFTPSDDIKFEVEQWWTFKSEGPWPTDHIESNKNEVADFKKDGTRTVRMRLRNKSEGHYTARFLIDHKNPESFKPLPPVEPNTFRNVRFDFKSLQGKNGNAHVVIDFDIVNTGDTKTVGVALHGPSSLAYAGQVEIIGSLNASDGTEFFIDELNGIKSMHSVASSLTPIEPHETRHVSLNFTKRATIFTPPSTGVYLTLRCEVIVNDDLRSSSYSPGYIADGSIPPGCRIESLYWKIPVRSDAQQ